MYPFNLGLDRGMMAWSGFGSFTWLITPILIWSFIWKGLALWRAARGQQLGWYIALLLINTIGILEIIYLCCFAKDKLNLKKLVKRSR